MTALARRTTVAETMAELFAPVEVESFADLLDEYERDLATMRFVSEALIGRTSVLRYFAEGNKVDGGQDIGLRLAHLGPAIKALDAAYWRRAIALTDIYETMPQARRTQWDDSLEDLDKVPTFSRESIGATFSELLAHRQQFFAERVSGCFEALSGEHVTNRPEGFGKRMILANVFDDDGYVVISRWSNKAGHIDDLRKAIAAFMGRGEPAQGSTMKLLRYVRSEHVGEWVSVDGNSWRIRVYKKGTAHIEVHPDMAYRLNCVLAYLHPNAIPPSARARPKKRPKVKLFDRPLPFAVLTALADVRVSKAGKSWEVWTGGNSHARDKHVESEVGRLLASLGGVPKPCRERTLSRHFYHFDYNPTSALAHVTATGVLPDDRAYQFYPTPDHIAERCAELARGGEMLHALEPSAGTGSLVRYLNFNRHTCVEASPLRAQVLRAQGFDVVEGNFFDVEPSDVGLVDAVVMNPPYDRGRWSTHVEHASGFVKEGGRLVAVLPLSAVKRLKLPGFTLSWQDRFDNDFAGTSISVVLLLATKDRT